MLTANSNKKFVLCITDAFTKYSVVMVIPNKNAETVADAIFKEWFANSEFWPRFIPMEEKIHQQIGLRDHGASECGAYQNFSSTSTVQFTSRSVQQNGVKV